MHERRKFERVNLPASAKVFATLADNQVLGPVTVLGRGGFMVDTKRVLALNQPVAIVIVEEKDGIRRVVRALPRYHSPEGVGFEFDGLEADAAVEIGVIIGRHYVSGA